MEEVKCSVYYWNKYLDRIRYWRRIHNFVTVSLSLSGIAAWFSGYLSPEWSAFFLVMVQIFTVYTITNESEKRIEVIHSALKKYNKLNAKIENVWVKMMAGALTEKQIRSFCQKANVRSTAIQSMLDKTALPLNQKIFQKSHQQVLTYMEKFNELSPEPIRREK